MEIRRKPKSNTNRFGMLTAVLVNMNRRLWTKSVLLYVISHSCCVKSRGNHVPRDHRLGRFRAVRFGPNWSAVLRRRIGESGIGRREDGERLWS